MNSRFTDGTTEAQGEEIACPRLHGRGLYSGFVAGESASRGLLHDHPTVLPLEEDDCSWQPTTCGPGFSICMWWQWSAPRACRTVTRPGHAMEGAGADNSDPSPPSAWPGGPQAPGFLGWPSRRPPHSVALLLALEEFPTLSQAARKPLISFHTAPCSEGGSDPFLPAVPVPASSSEHNFVHPTNESQI